MMDIPQGRIIARQPDDSAGHIVRRSEVKRQVEIGDRLELGIDPHEAPDEVGLIADRVQPVAGDGGETVNRHGQAAGLRMPGQRVADPFALAVGANEPLPGAEIRALGDRVASGRMVDHGHRRDVVQALRTTARSPIEQGHDAVDIGRLQGRIGVQEIDLGAAVIDGIALVTHEARPALAEPEPGMAEIAGENFDPVIVPRVR